MNFIVNVYNFKDLQNYDIINKKYINIRLKLLFSNISNLRNLIILKFNLRELLINIKSTYLKLT